MADPGRPVKKRARRTVHTYVLQRRFTCTLCARKMEGNWSNGQAYYRCRYPAEYARTNHVNHPLQVYVREADVLPALDKWLARAFAPHRFDETIALMLAAQGGAPGADVEITRARAKIAECDRKIAGYQAPSLTPGATRPPSPDGPARPPRSALPLRRFARRVTPTKTESQARRPPLRRLRRRDLRRGRRSSPTMRRQSRSAMKSAARSVGRGGTVVAGVAGWSMKVKSAAPSGAYSSGFSSWKRCGTSPVDPPSRERPNSGAG